MKTKAFALATVGSVALLIVTHAFASPPSENVRGAFLRWTKQTLHPISIRDLNAPTHDLDPLVDMIGEARIVGLSEGNHAAAEPLIFRNRVFKHLVENAGFTAIAMESGIVESRVLNDYVTNGRGELDDALTNGLSNGFGTFRQNAELLEWMKEYNARLPAGATKIQIFGLDVPGSPGNFDAARGPDTALRVALDYLKLVDPSAQATLHPRVEKYLPILRGINGYGDLKQVERDALTAAIADLISLIERQELTYVAKSSQEEFDWAERSAIGARQTDAWFRRMPLEWKLENGLEWTEAAMHIRDRSMADNLEWVQKRIGENGRVLVFAATGHLASTVVRTPTHFVKETIPLGAHVRHRHGNDYVSILNVIVNGEIKYCSANPRKVMPLKPPPDSTVETVFAAVNAPSYLLDLRGAPRDVAVWLQQVHDHWNGFRVDKYSTGGAFDLVYYVSPLTSACTADP